MKFSKTFLITSALVFGSVAPQAMAGFEWVEAPKRESVKPSPAPAQQPVMAKKEAAPIVLQQKTSADNQASSAPQLIINPQPLAAQQPSQAPAMMAPATPAHNFEIVQGFGSDMPLALALSQIVPADYAYSFRGNVNPGQRVSWSGGKPWNVVLNDALKSLNLKAIVSGKTVIIAQDTAFFDKYEDARPLMMAATMSAPSALETATLKINPFPLADQTEMAQAEEATTEAKKKLRLMLS